MQIIRSSATSRKKKLAAVLVVIVLLGGGVAVAAIENIGPFAKEAARKTESATSTTPSEPDGAASEDEDIAPDDELVDGQRSPSGEGGTKPLAGGSGSSGNASSFGVSVDPLVDGAEVRFSTLIQKVANSGSCKLTVSNGSKTVERSAQVGQLGNQSTCQGFVIPKSEFSSGNWRVSLRVTIGSQTSNASASFRI